MRPAEAAPSLLRRIAAFAIDLAVLNFIVLQPFRVLVIKLTPGATFMERYQSMAGSTGRLLAANIVLAAMAAIAVLYFAILEYRLGQSIGKLIMRLEVRSLGRKLCFWQCIVRALLVIPLFPFYLLWVADPAFALFNSNQQRLLEWLSKTRTVQRWELWQASG